MIKTNQKKSKKKPQLQKKKESSLFSLLFTKAVYTFGNCTHPIVPFPDIGGLGGFWVGGVVRGSPPIFIFCVLTCMKEWGEKWPSLSSASSERDTEMPSAINSK